jgi:hypothetical protein
MAISRLKIESVKKGRALRKALYIERVMYFGDQVKRKDLRHVAHGSMPKWCRDQPMEFWRAADELERANAAACKEVLLPLPRELTFAQNVRLTESWVRHELPGKPYHYAIHENNPGDYHAHVVFSDRTLDEHDRPRAQFFRRFNRTAPSVGGARKGTGGKSPIAVRQDFTQMKQRWDDLQNVALAAASHPAAGCERSPNP